MLVYPSKVLSSWKYSRYGMEVSSVLYEIGVEEKLCLCMGKIITYVEDKMVRHGIKQLDGALWLSRYMWETAGMKRKLETCVV